MQELLQKYPYMPNDVLVNDMMVVVGVFSTRRKFLLKIVDSSKRKIEVVYKSIAMEGDMCVCARVFFATIFYVRHVGKCFFCIIGRS